jgi:hypothetical protein
VSEVEHLPLVSDELFARAQERFRQRPRSNGRRGSKTYLFTGMVRCASGHQPTGDVRPQPQGLSYVKDLCLERDSSGQAGRRSRRRAGDRRRLVLGSGEDLSGATGVVVLWALGG